MSESNQEELMESDDDESTPKTVSEVLEEITQAWQNEKSAPEILKHMSDHVDCLLHHITCMEKNIEPLPKDDLRVTVHKMEIDRIRYLISSYLRTRLEKIELYAIDIIKEEAKRSENDRYLSDAELKFARDWAMNMETLLKSIVLQHLPGTFQELEIDKLTVKPNLNSHVFIRANKTVEGVIIPGTDEELNITEGSQHLVQYKAIAHLVKDGSVKLL
ncbi:DNA replication complex GINS protein SLD5 [Microplitis demolitor]|uniref:DNA replication complex GINS protein SLD5 n=1 Tax=Microplitis demolitor TaxID=69319 RepID=UPI0004CD97FC|nr:DNA replication complex GINS protein SLD5 [Microplitis demolitor]